MALLWGINNKNTLYTAIKRYVQKGILISIHKGFYSTIPLDQLVPIRLALGFLHRFAYVSCETILINKGIIFQKENYYSLVSDISTNFTIVDKHFKVRKMKDKYLFNDQGIIKKDGIAFAGVERAVIDILYFNPTFNFDNRAGVNWQKVKKMQKEMRSI